MKAPAQPGVERLDWSQTLRPLEAGESPIQVPPTLPYRDLIPDDINEAAVLVPLWTGDDGLEIVLTRRTHQLRRHAGQISFPGGRVEADDRTRLQAALRETEEEVGISRHEVDTIGCLDPIITITGYAVVPFVGLVDQRARLVPDPGEVAEIFTVPLSFILSPENCRRERAWFKGREREFYVFPYGEYQIWGATASMLVDLAGRIRDECQ